MELRPEQVAQNVSSVRHRIAESAKRSGRVENDICLVAVTKYVDADTTRLLIEAGCEVLGESRPQQLWQKAEQLADCSNVQWHQIGHMQRNKLPRTLPIISMLESVDSVRLIQSINDLSAKLGITTRILLEVNISGDENKNGFATTSVADVVRSVSDYANVSLDGLMGMASLHGGDERARRDFAALRELRNSLIPECPDGVSLEKLSMGMSSDFEIAIEEGANIVRVGSALFQPS